MACFLLDTKPYVKPLLTYCELDKKHLNKIKIENSLKEMNLRISSLCNCIAEIS